MNELTHLDLFSGIGGFALAAQRAGFRTVGFSEVEPYACRVLAERFPGVPNLGDVRKRESFAGLGNVTVLTGGFPCQPWSLAGKQRGASDDRHLWPAMCDVIKTVRPAWIIGENVPGLIALGLDGVLTDLETCGYESQTFVIPACGVDARHKRERLWVVANASGGRFGGASGGESELPRRTKTLGRSEALADSDKGGLRRTGAPGQAGHAALCGKALGPMPGRGSRWIPEPDVGRVAHGIPNRAHRLKGLGNAIVPQVVEPFFHWIRQIEAGEIT